MFRQVLPSNQIDQNGLSIWKLFLFDIGEIGIRNIVERRIFSYWRYSKRLEIYEHILAFAKIAVWHINNKLQLLFTHDVVYSSEAATWLMIGVLLANSTYNRERNERGKSFIAFYNQYNGVYHFLYICNIFQETKILFHFFDRVFSKNLIFLRVSSMWRTMTVKVNNERIISSITRQCVFERTLFFHEFYGKCSIWSYCTWMHISIRWIILSIAIANIYRDVNIHAWISWSNCE